MMSRTGSRAFTLVEVMVAVAVLALGTVLLYTSYFRAADILGYNASYLHAAVLLNEKIWQAQDGIRHFGLQLPQASGEWDAAGRSITWQLRYSAADSSSGDGTIYRIDVEAYWKQSGRDFRVTRTAYEGYYGDPA